MQTAVVGAAPVRKLASGFLYLLVGVASFVLITLITDLIR
jgi:hypothetical protein